MSDGVRSIQAFWMGGAAAVPGVVTAGVRSMQAFWMGGASVVPGEPPPPPPPGPDLPGGIENTARWPPNVRVKWGFEREQEVKQPRAKPTPAPRPAGEPVPLRVVPWTPAAEAHVFAAQPWPSHRTTEVTLARAAAAAYQVGLPKLWPAIQLDALGVAIALPEVFTPGLNFVVDDRAAARAALRRRNQQAAARLAARYLLDGDEDA